MQGGVRDGGSIVLQPEWVCRRKKRDLSVGSNDVS
jgi:hypothetical protein